MMHGFKKGIYDGWSPYFDHSSYNSLVKSEQLPVPNKKNYTVEEVGVDLQQELADLGDNPLSLDLTIHILNKAKPFDRIKEIDHPRFAELVEVINNHNSFNYSTTSLKNYVVRNIIETSNHAKNQISSYSPITFGEYEDIKKKKTLNFVCTLMDGMSMDQQQETNAVGKDVIGVAANGIKDYFALVEYFSNYYDKGFKKTDREYFEREFSLDGINKIKVNRIAGLSLQTKSIEILNKHLNLGLGAIAGQIKDDRGNVLNTVLDPYSDPALTLSALLSASTDNAKELILKTINAGKEFAAMHIYMIILGFSEGAVAEFMTSPDIITWMDQNMKSNLYFKDQEPKLINLSIASIADPYIDKNSMDSDTLLEFKKIYNLSKELTSIARILKINQGLKASHEILYSYFKNIENDFLEREVQFASDTFAYIKKEKGLSDQAKKADYLKDMIIKDKPYLAGLDSHIDSILTAAKEFGISEGGFTFEKYFSDNEYKNAAINYYDLIKGTYNVLDVVDKLDHFKGMVDATKISYDTIKSMSKKSIFVTETVREVLAESKINTVKYKVYGTNSVSLNTKQQEQGKNLFDDFMITKWFNVHYNRGVFDLVDVQKLTNSPVTYYDGKGGLNNLGTDSVPIDFSTSSSLDNFKHIMENNILPYLKKMYADNQFLSGLVLRRATGINRTWISTRVRMNRLTDPKNLDLLHNYQKGFNELVDDDVTIKLGDTNFKVTDLFFIYNLLVNKDKSGSDRLTKLFNEYIINTDNISKDWYEFYSRIDSGDEELFDDSFPLNDDKKRVIEFGVLNTGGILKLTKDKYDRDDNLVKGPELKLPNSNSPLMTSLIQKSSDYKYRIAYQKLIRAINDKNALIEQICPPDVEV